MMIHAFSMQSLLHIGVLLAPTFAPVFQSILALALVATLLNAAIVSIWYVLGAALNNARAKQGAVNEYYQLIGNVAVIALVLFAMTTFSVVFANALANAPHSLMNPSLMLSTCSNIAQYNKQTGSVGGTPIPGLSILSNANSLLSGGPTTGTPSGPYSPGLCYIVADAAPPSAQAAFVTTLGATKTTPAATSLIDYPLAATGVVIANLTNQTAVNLNDLFLTDSLIGFLSNLKAQLNICIGAGTCLPFVPHLVELSLEAAPLAGYSLIYNGLGIVGNLMLSSLEFFVGQLILVIITLYIWPFLLFAGFVLRSTTFTRRLGGLFIALAIAGAIIFPAVFAIEYYALGNGFALPSLQNANTIYGFSPTLNIPNAVVSSDITWPNVYWRANIPGCVVSVVTPSCLAAGVPPKPYGDAGYAINFFVEPRISDIANYYGCYPAGVQPNGADGTQTPPGVKATNNNVHVVGGNLLTAEIGDMAYLSLPVAGLFTTLGSTIVSLYNTFFNGAPTFPLPFYCAPQNALNMMFVFVWVYGIIGVTAYFLPIINIIIVIVAVRGLSGLMGGDTQLAGIGNFV